ncbi:MAG: penicillin-binding protein activator [Alphaproteobacteria bacterium]|nr:penicillin-binding protein activator [Alphaproteobacteria bacterium]
MFIKNFLYFIGLLGILAGCSTQTKTEPTWDYSEITNPTQLRGIPNAEYDTNAQHNVVALLPLSGENADIGRSIQYSIELAALEAQPNPMFIKFYDTEGESSLNTIQDALSTNPEFIIGPVFAPEARIVRNKKSDDIPVLSFTSDRTAIGDGVMSIALLPINSIEAIVQEITNDNVKNIIIVAPETDSGHLMAGAALTAADINDIEISGIFFYSENDSESIKMSMSDASAHEIRSKANNKAREILSDILTNETLTELEDSSISVQLDKLSKTEYLGKLPYSAVLFLGNAIDTKSLASFLRYYEVDSRSVRFYGTALWDDSDIASDFTMSGAKYATLPETEKTFSAVYAQISGFQPSKIASFGYDATKIASLFLNKKTGLTTPSGFNGVNGIVRFNSNGTNERAMRIMYLNASGTPREIKHAKTNFKTQLYKLSYDDIESADGYSLSEYSVDPMDYISIPERFIKKYKKTKSDKEMLPQTQSAITIVNTDTGDSLKASDYKSVKHESIKQKLIDSVEIQE